jgi:hypothetical protein
MLIKLKGLVMKLIGILSDLHCGHLFGITPPDYFTKDYHEESRELYQDMRLNFKGEIYTTKSLEGDQDGKVGW